MDEDAGDAGTDPSPPTTRPAGYGAGPVTGRRAFLGALAAAGGVGAGLSWWSSGDDVGSAGHETVQIVYAYSRAGDDARSIEPRRKTVPTDWYRNLTRALSVHRELPTSELTGVLGSFVVPGDFDEPAASIALRTTAERLRDEVAALSLDVDVSIDVIDELPDPVGESGPLQPTVTADLGERSVPGGVLCGHGQVRGSLAPALSDPRTDRRYFATANHLYGGSGTDHRGDPLSLYDGRKRASVGDVHRGFADDDLLLAEPTAGYVPAREISGARPGEVGGQFTRLGLADLQARGESLRMTGAVSGRTSGEIKGVDGVTFYTGEGVRTGQLLWGNESTFTDGDSGSVNYHADPEDDDRVLVGGVNSARTWWPGAEFTWGTAAYAIRERHGLVF